MIAIDQSGGNVVADLPAINTIDADDLRWSLNCGWSDFLEFRGDLLFIAVLYPMIGFGTAAITLNSSLLPLFFPLVAGLSILGPIVAAGFYEFARRRERGEAAGWSHFLDPLRSERRAGIVALMSLLIVAFLGWLLVAWLLYQITVGRLEPVGLPAFLDALFYTAEGWTLIIAGNIAGGLFAVLTLVLTVVSVPMVVDQAVDPMLAVRTSIRAVSANRLVMLRWGATVAALLLVGTIPLFIGLAVVLPVLGYATWHLYTRLVSR